MSRIDEYFSEVDELVKRLENEGNPIWKVIDSSEILPFDSIFNGLVNTSYLSDFGNSMYHVYTVA